MKEVSVYIISFYIWIIASLTSLVLVILEGVVRLVISPFDPKLAYLHGLNTLWAQFFLAINPLWNLRISGKENRPKEKAVVIVANHQSILDILVIQQLRMPFKWVSKPENFRIPVLGWIMRLNKYIEVQRDNGPKAFKMFQEASDALSLGSSIAIFPEDTRSLDGQIKDFKDGAFLIAQKNKVGILPVIVDGTLDSLPKKGFIMHKRVILTMLILPIIPYELIQNSDIHMLKNNVRSMMIDALLKWRAEKCL